MNQAPPPLLIALAALVFMGSLLGYAGFSQPMRQAEPLSTAQLMTSLAEEAPSRWGYVPATPNPVAVTQEMFLGRGSTALSLVTLVALLAALRYAQLTLREARLMRAGLPSPEEDEREEVEDDAPSARSLGLGAFAGRGTGAHWGMVLALLAGAAWPWLGRWHVVPGAVAALLMAMGALSAIWPKRGAMRLRMPGRTASMVGLFAGWALVAAVAALADLVAQTGDFTLTHTVIAATLALALLGPAIQLTIGARIGFSVSVICALLGLAAVAIQSDPTAALAAVIGIAAMTIAVVGVTN